MESDQKTEKLLTKIDALEKRVKELEEEKHKRDMEERRKRWVIYGEAM